MSIGISSSLPLANLNQSVSASKLSDEQKEAINAVLSDYDASSLTEQDAKEIVSAFQGAGIQPSKEFADALDSAGFNAREIGGLAGVPEQRGSNVSPSEQGESTAGVNQDNLQLLQSILEKYNDLSNLSQEDETELSAILLDAGLLEPGALIDTKS